MSEPSSAAAKPSDDVGIRIALYGTGKIGGLVAQLAPEMGHPVVAAVAHDPSKAGRALGEVLGGPAVDIVVTDDLEETLAKSGADVLFYAGMSGSALVTAVDLATRAGVDFVTATFADPVFALGTEASRLETQARESGSRVFGSGMVPGLWIDYLPGVLATALPGPRRIFVQRSSDPSVWGAAVLRSELGIGGRPEDAPETFKDYLEQSARILATALGTEIDKFDWLPEQLLAEAPVEVDGMTVEPNRVIGFNHHIRGMVDGDVVFDLGWRAEIGGGGSITEIRVEGPNSLSVRAQLELRGDAYSGTVVRVLASLAPLRQLPGGFYNPAHVSLAAAGASRTLS